MKIVVVGNQIYNGKLMLYLNFLIGYQGVYLWCVFCSNLKFYNDKALYCKEMRQ